MIYLIVFLTLSHLITLYLIYKYIGDYKKNNHNYISKELKKIGFSFASGTEAINTNVSTFSTNTTRLFNVLKQDNLAFQKDHKKKFSELTSFIKSDYQSLTNLLKVNNHQLSSLLSKTEESITKNNQLKPLLTNSHQELEKIYAKTKMLVSNYEKSLKDIKNEMEDTMTSLENISDTKIKEIAMHGEKTISSSLEISKGAIEEVTQETNAGLKKVLKENQIKLLGDRLVLMEEQLKQNILDVTNSIKELDQVLFAKLKKHQEELKDKKGFFGF